MAITTLSDKDLVTVVGGKNNWVDNALGLGLGAIWLDCYNRLNRLIQSY
ncbi:MULTISPECIES: hypothetical protein [unclassified Lactobacillus]|nr:MULTISPECIES: hypothetical protein [unclassified Lactobacillus]